jgi:hypothetical protein
MLAIGTDMFPKQIPDHDLRLFLHIYSTLEDDFPELLFKCVNLFDGLYMTRRKFKPASFLLSNDISVLVSRLLTRQLNAVSVTN